MVDPHPLDTFDVGLQFWPAFDEAAPAGGGGGGAHADAAGSAPIALRPPPGLAADPHAAFHLAGGGHEHGSHFPGSPFAAVLSPSTAGGLPHGGAAAPAGALPHAHAPLGGGGGGGGYDFDGA